MESGMNLITENNLWQYLLNGENETIEFKGEVETFGKGTVQQVKKLSDGSMIKYTIENWLTPNGNWIDGEGVEPTDEVILSEEYYKNPVVDNDNQLQKALELVSK